MNPLLVLDWANIAASCTADGWFPDLGAIPLEIGRLIGEPVEEGVVVAPQPPNGGIRAAAIANGFVFSGRRHTGDARKCNMDVEVAIECLRRAGTNRTVVLGSADSDFIPLAEWLADAGHTVLFFGHRMAASRLLRNHPRFPFLDAAASRHFLEHRKDRRVVPSLKAPRELFPLLAPLPATDPRPAVVIDVPALYSAAASGGWRPDLRKVAQAAVPGGGPVSVELVVRCDTHLPAMERLAGRERWGLRVIPGGGGGVTRKAQPDVVLSLAANEAAVRHNDVLLVTGNGEFTRLIDALQRSARRVGVAFVQERCSRALASQADAFTPLYELNVGFPRRRDPATPEI